MNARTLTALQRDPERRGDAPPIHDRVATRPFRGPFLKQEVHMFRFILLALCPALLGPVLLGMPVMAHAQDYRLTAHAREYRPVPTDQKYCVALSDIYSRYVVATTETPRANAAGAYAKATCKQHQPLAGIPILEAKLERAKVPLP